MDIITSGVSAQVRETTKAIGTLVREMMRENMDASRRGLQFDKLFDEVQIRCERKGINKPSEVDFRNSLKDLEEQSVIGLFKHARNPLVRLLESTE